VSGGRELAVLGVLCQVEAHAEQGAPRRGQLRELRPGMLFRPVRATFIGAAEEPRTTRRVGSRRDVVFRPAS
jgi:hypothetical protein